MAFEIVVKIEESSMSQRSPGATEEPSIQRRVTKITVDSDWLSYDEVPAHLVVLDLARRRRLEVDKHSSTCHDESLFTVVGLRHYELPNRAHIRGVLKAGGAAQEAEFAPIAVEHQLALRDPSLQTTLGGSLGTPEAKLERSWRSLFNKRRHDIEIRSDRDGWLAETAGKRWLSCSADGPRIPDVGRGYVQFLRYRYGGHPLLLDQLASLHFLPQELTLHALAPLGLGTNVVRLQIETVQSLAVSRPDTPEMRKVDSLEGDPADEVIRAAREVAADEPIETEAARIGSSLRGLRSENPLEGLLSFFELTLETGIAMPPEIADQLKANTDNRVKLLLGVLAAANNCRDKDVLDQAIRALAQLEPAAMSKRHVLWAFEANYRASSGDVNGAKERLLRVIQASPRLTGAYKDLGDLFLRAFDSRRAWRCWEIARGIAPAHPALRAVAALEARLSSDHPEYFAA